MENHTKYKLDANKHDFGDAITVPLGRQVRILAGRGHRAFHHSNGIVWRRVDRVNEINPSLEVSARPGEGIGSRWIGKRASRCCPEPRVKQASLRCHRLPRCAPSS
jgi:hypothetical protein